MKNKALEFYKRKLEPLKTSKNNIINFSTMDQKTVYASYKINKRIAQTNKLHKISESLILSTIKNAIGVMFDEKSLKEVENISLSNNTVSSKIDEISQWVELIERVNLSKRSSLNSQMYKAYLSLLFSYVIYYGWINLTRICYFVNRLFQV